MPSFRGVADMVSMHGLDLSFMHTSPPVEPPAKPSRKAWGARSDLACPRIISDNLEFKSMVDGTPITSRSQYREHLKRHGYIELGNDIPKPESKEAKARKQRKSIQADLRQAIQMHEQGYRNRPLETADKLGIAAPPAGKVSRSNGKEPAIIL